MTMIEFCALLHKSSKKSVTRSQEGEVARSLDNRLVEMQLWLSHPLRLRVLDALVVHYTGGNPLVGGLKLGRLSVNRKGHRCSKDLR
jgi:hypothetical protein